jgi:putative nucleotide binding protein
VEGYRHERRGRAKTSPPHPALVERTALVLDYMRTGYYMDPHKHHRNAPVAQAIGCERFTLLDGIPISGEVDFFDKVTNLMETLKIAFYLDEEGGKTVQRRKSVHLACLPDRRLYCYSLTPIGEKERSILPLSFDEPENVVILSSYDELEELLKNRGLPTKVLAVPSTPISYEDLTMTAKENLPEAIRRIITEKEELFVEFFNVAEPINVRLHAIELLKGIGKRVLMKILEERRRRPFTKFEEIKKILKKDPVTMLAEKVLEEIKGEAKYYLFVRPRDPSLPFLDYLSIMRRSYESRRRG